jgi:two-component system, chemotaxis family, response regulator Rcp1
MDRMTVGRPMELLLVEDSLLAGRLALGAIRQCGFEHRLTWLRDGQEAIDFLSQTGRFSKAPTPDLVLLDLVLPSRLGREVLSMIRQSAPLHTLPVVIMTGEAGEEDEAACRSLQVEAYLAKPLDVPKFMQVVEELRHHWQADMILPSRPASVP